LATLTSLGGVVARASESVPVAAASGLAAASGDLAVKKTYPALFALFRHKLLPPHFAIVGYARSKMAEDEFRKKISSKFGDKFPAELKAEFLKHCTYHQGQYDSSADFHSLHVELLKSEAKALGVSMHNDNEPERMSNANRIFYMALPPTAFVPAAKSIRAAAYTHFGWNRLVVEKPFGRDSESSAQLGRDLGSLFNEHEVYRIDHYLVSATATVAAVAGGWRWWPWKPLSLCGLSLNALCVLWRVAACARGVGWNR
jgi:glucose-6-phosphate 1-dehydrogenase